MVDLTTPEAWSTLADLTLAGTALYITRQFYSAYRDDKKAHDLGKDDADKNDKVIQGLHLSAQTTRAKASYQSPFLMLAIASSLIVKSIASLVIYFTANPLS